MAAPIDITQISLYKAATTSSINRWKDVLGDDLAQAKESMETFLSEIPEYRALPAYLILGFGDARPDDYSPELKYMYQFFARTEGQLDGLMLKDSGEFATAVVPELSKVKVVLDSPRRKGLIEKIKAAESHSQYYMQKFDEATKEASELYDVAVAEGMKTVTLREELEHTSGKVSIDFTDKIAETVEVMSGLGFQYMSTEELGDCIKIYFVVHPRKMYSGNSRGGEAKRGTYHAPFMMSLKIRANMSCELYPEKNSTRLRQVHPHISGGICWGNGNVSRLKKEGKTTHLLTQFDSMLRIYNYLSPYITLKDYKEFSNFKVMSTSDTGKLVDFVSDVKTNSSVDLELQNVIGTEFLTTLIKLNPDLADKLAEILLGSVEKAEE